ncbi:transporter substrate-binding domain-containing protein [Thalassotalea sp. G2M2-11]|uniref:substrate-binding periplasmic protein n=1 Tax=Thalassotalea sp. G2M2-11 TaxID=2787627 RepID=UPI0019D12F33|nr:transporter substrate-binding domain-containing protein [Thalassotalea sp. G2M2-11]
MYKLVNFFSYILVLLSLYPLNAFTAETTYYQIDVVTEYLAPYQTQNSDGSLGGFATEVIHALFEQAQSEANITVMPWARAYQTAITNENIMIYSMAKTAKRTPLFRWVGKLTKERLFFWGLKNQFFQDEIPLALLKGKRIAATKNSNIEKYLTRHNFFNTHLITRETQAIRMLYLNRVDLIIDTEINMIAKTRSLGLDIDIIKKIGEVIELNNDLAIAFNLNSDEKMVKHFQQAYGEISKNGVLNQLKQKWQITETQ